MTSPQQTIANTLEESLRAAGQRAYLLIDPYLREPFDEPFLTSLAADITSIPLTRPSVADDQRPRLIEWRSTSSELLQASVAAAFAEQADPNQEAIEGFMPE